MICIDTMVLIWGVQKYAQKDRDKEVNENIELAGTFIKHIAKEGESIIIPAPVVMEYLAGLEDSVRSKHLAILDNFGTIASLDTKASALAAKLHRRYQNKINKRIPKGEKPRIATDTMILAIALSQNASMIVTHNQSDFTKLIDNEEITISDIPRYPHQGNLYDMVGSE